MTYEESKKRYFDFLNFRKQGFSFNKIGKLFGISGQCVGWRIRNGIPKNPVIQKGVLCLYKMQKLEGRDRVRMLIRIRDNFTCQECKKILTIEQAKKDGKRLFDIHHLNGQCGKNSRGYDRKSEMNNLITLCHKCHFNRHDRSKKFLNYEKAN